MKSCFVSGRLKTPGKRHYHARKLLHFHFRGKKDECRNTNSFLIVTCVLIDRQSISLSYLIFTGVLEGRQRNMVGIEEINLYIRVSFLS